MIPNTCRFFVSPSILLGDTLFLTDKTLVHQIGRVLRMHAGDSIVLLDNSGYEFVVQLTEVTRTHIAGDVMHAQCVTTELSFDIHVYVAFIRPERFEWVLQKGTELGVRSFVPVWCERSQQSDRTAERKQERWERIVREAAEQSCRGRVPTIAPAHTFVAACQHATTCTSALLLWEGQQSPTSHHLSVPLAALNTVHNDTPTISIALVSGPEGGITPHELTIAVEHGMIPITLGRRILRAETAPIAAIAAIVYELER